MVGTIRVISLRTSPKSPTSLLRLFAGASVLIAAIGAWSGTAAPVARAAAVSLTELGGTPLRAPYGGWYADAAVGNTFSSPAIADVTGDGRSEIVVGGMNSNVYVYDIAHGQTIVLNPGGYELSTFDPGKYVGNTPAAPAIGDLDGDDVADVVITNTGARVAAYSVRGGTPTELYNRFAAPAFEGATNGLFATPALGYVDRDDRLDVVTSNWGQTVEAWSGPTGEPIPQVHQWVLDSIWSSPAIGDITGDGTQSIVVGGDCDGGGPSQPCHPMGGGGYVWAFDFLGRERWRHFVPRAVIWSSPALIDLTGDGALDVVVGTGLFWLGPEANKLIALDGRTGAVLWEAATEGPTFGSPSVGMVDGQPRVWSMVGGGKLHSWDARGRLLWATCVTDGDSCDPAAGTWGGAAIADVNDDGRLDAVVAAEQKLRVLDAVTGAEQTEVRSSYPGTLFSSNSTPTVAQVDGQTWIVHHQIGDLNGNLQRDAGDESVVTVWTTGSELGDAPWPTFKGNMARTGGPLPEPADPLSQPPPPGQPLPPLAPASRLCLDRTGTSGDAAIVNLTPTEAAGSGFGVLTSSATAGTPEASNVNFGVGTLNPNVGVAPVGSDGRACFRNSHHTTVHLIADHLGTLDASVYTPAAADGEPSRKVDTRIGLGGARLEPGARVCFAVAGPPGDAALVNITPVGADGPGDGLLTSSDVVTPPLASNVNFAPGSVDPNLTIAPIGSDGQVCFHNSVHASVDVIADHLGTIAARFYTPANPSGAPERRVDTRVGLGGTRLRRSERLCMQVSGAPGDAAVVNLTPVVSDVPGFGLLTSSSVVQPPAASNVNFSPTSVDPNVAIAPIGADGSVCFHNSKHGTVDLIADHLGTISANAYTPADPTGAPARLADTRLGIGVG